MGKTFCRIALTVLVLLSSLHRSTESDSEVDSHGGGGPSHGTAADLEQAQGGVERSRFSQGRIAEFKELAADPRVYEKVAVLFALTSVTPAHVSSRGAGLVEIYGLLSTVREFRGRS